MALGQEVATMDAMGIALTARFYRRSVLTVAEELLGKYLCCGEQVLRITEVEAYDGPFDLACHASKGRTDRTEPMFGPAGCWYVYLCYGMYWMLNIVTGEEGYPAAVLIRGVDGWGGPGKLTKYLGIDARFNARVANEKTGLWIEDRGNPVDPVHIKRTPRIGVAYAKEWADKPYRFVLV